MTWCCLKQLSVVDGFILVVVMSCFPAVAEEDNDLEGETMEETKETKNIMEEGNREKDEAVDVKKD